MTRATYDYRETQPERGQFYDRLPVRDYQKPADNLWASAQRFSIAEPDQVRLHRKSLIEARAYLDLALTNAGIEL